tara:strand:+ start:2388 stop:2603 length:216 start_codon:yes stop_codon:yes gene_type:complete
MSRALTDVARAYYNMDIENMPSDKPEKPKGGLLSKSSMNKMNNGLDLSNPVVRVAKQMKVIRDFREEVKNG